MGDVKDEAMIEPEPGRRAFCCFERDLLSFPKPNTVSTRLTYPDLGSASIDSPFSHPVYLEINPPNTGDPQNTPQRSLLPKRPNREPLQHSKVAKTHEYE